MNIDGVPDSFYIAFVTLLLNGKQQLIAIGNEFNLTLMQTLTLLVLAGVGELSMSNFSSLYDCDASNVTGIIDGLEQKKLVARHFHPSDRRIKMIHLEPAGVKLQTKLMERLTETSGYLFRDLTATERKKFAQLVLKIGTDLRQQ